MEVRVGWRRTIVIPRAGRRGAGHPEGGRLGLRVEGGRIVLEPFPDAVELSLHGEKIAGVSLEELEAESVWWQRRYAGG